MDKNIRNMNEITKYEMDELVLPVQKSLRILKAAYRIGGESFMEKQQAVRAAGAYGEVYYDVEARVWVGVPRENIKKALKKAYLKRWAKKIGLVYWPALYPLTENNGVDIDPMAFVWAEKALKGRNGLWGEKKLTSARVETLNGGWDSEGHYGLSPHDVKKYWFLSGCKPSEKFFVLVRNHNSVSKMNNYNSVRKGDAPEWTKNYLKGYAWLQKHQLFNDRYSRKAIASIGRLSANLRWASVNLVAESTTGTIRIRDLDWGAVKVAQRGTRVAEGFMPEAIRNQRRWVKTVPSFFSYSMKRQNYPVGVLEIDPLTLKLATLTGLVKKLDWENDANILACINLTRLFGANTTALNKFVSQHRNIHDAGQFILGSNTISPKWGELVLRAPTTIKYSAMFAEIEMVNNGVPETKADFMAALESCPSRVRLAGFQAEHDLPDYEYELYAQLFATQPKSFIGTPAPGGKDGIELGDYSIRQLDSGDTLAPIAGRLVNCCMHLYGAAASCARQTWQEGDAGLWAVFKGSTIVGATFVWRSEKGTAIVLDSIESHSAHSSIVAKLNHMAAKAVVGVLGVEKVYIGDTNYGVTQEVAMYGADGSTKMAPKCSFNLSYTDAHKVKLLVKSENNVSGKAVRASMREAVKQAAAEVPAVATNALMEGSGVFCEHCDAEVNPDCEICPTCGQNIAEWV